MRLRRRRLTESELQAIELELQQLQLDEAIGKARREKYIEMLKKHRPDLDPEKAVDAIGNYGSSKAEKVAIQWTIKNQMDPFTDKEKVLHALKVAGNKKVDPLGYEGPAALLDVFAGEIKEPPVDPDDYLGDVFTRKQEVYHGVTIYTISEEESEIPREACRHIVNTHFGKDANPWCLLQADEDGNLTDDSAHYWYDGYPGEKRMAFQNGKLIAFYADEQWWDRQDNPNDRLRIAVPFPNDTIGGRKIDAEYDLDRGKCFAVSDPYRGNKRNGVYEEWYRDNPSQLRLRAEYREGSPVGKYEEWYSTGGKAKEFSYVSAGRFAGMRQGVQREWYENGQLKQVRNYDPEGGLTLGEQREYYPNGQLKELEIWAQDKLTGHRGPTGVSKWWYEDGTLKQETHYDAECKPGVQHGPEIEYDITGAVFKRATYNDGKMNGVRELWDGDQIRERTPYRHGMKHGLQERWLADGKRQSRVNYKNNMVHGLFETWYENGNLKIRSEQAYGKQLGKHEEWYEDGKPKQRLTTAKDQLGRKINVGEYKGWHRNGQLATFNLYDTKGEPDGEWKQYYKNGQLKKSENWVHGKEEGRWTRYYEDGQMESRATYRDGELHGLFETWYKNGQKESEVTYKENKRHGRCSKWYPDGQLKSQTEYKNRFLNGVIKRWRANGQMSEETVYKDGRRNGPTHEWYADGQLKKEALYDNGKLISAPVLNGRRTSERTIERPTTGDNAPPPPAPPDAVKEKAPFKTEDWDELRSKLKIHGHVVGDGSGGLDMAAPSAKTGIEDVIYRIESDALDDNAQGYSGLSKIVDDPSGKCINKLIVWFSGQREIFDAHGVNFNIGTPFTKWAREKLPEATSEAAARESFMQEMRPLFQQARAEMAGKSGAMDLSRKDRDWMRLSARRNKLTPTAYAASNVTELWAETAAYVAKRGKAVSDALKKLMVQTLSGMDKATAMESLSEAVDVQGLFNKLGTAQRGAPERAMIAVQRAMGGGVLNPVVEHVGDLTHRMTEWVQMSYGGYDAVSDKVDRVLRALTDGYGFEREMEENIVSNARYDGVNVSDYRRRVYAALDKYAAAHKALPVFNEVQRLARDAAVFVGQRKFDRATANLRKLKSYLDEGPDAWRERAMAYSESLSEAKHKSVNVPAWMKRLSKKKFVELAQGITWKKHLKQIDTPEFPKLDRETQNRKVGYLKHIEKQSGEIHRMVKDAYPQLRWRGFWQGADKVPAIEFFYDSIVKELDVKPSDYGFAPESDKLFEGLKGSNRPETGRKRDLIIRIQMQWSADGKKRDQIEKETPKLRRMTVPQLQDYYKQMFESCILEDYHSDNPMSREPDSPPPARLKAAFLAPATPDAGKAALESFTRAGFKTIRQGYVNRFLDIAERTPQGDYWTTRARQVELAEMKAAARGRVPVVIDIREVRDPEKAKQQLERAGYDCYYIPIGVDACAHKTVREHIQLFGKRNTVAIEDTAESVASFVRAGTRRAIREIMRRPVYNWRARLLWESIPGFERWVYYNGKIVTVTTDHHYGMLNVDSDLKKSGATWEDAVRVYKFEQRRDPKLRKKFRGLVRLGKFRDRVTAIFDGWPQHPPKGTVKKVLTALQNFTGVPVRNYDVQVMWMDGGQLYPAKEPVKESGDGLPYFVSTSSGSGAETAEVAHNPSRKDIKRLLDASGYAYGNLRVWLLPKVALVWNPYFAVHNTVMKMLPTKYRDIAIPIRYQVGTDEVYVTDAAKGTKWYRNKEIANEILSHPWIKRMGVRKVFYFDEDIVGPWHELEESIDESVRWFYHATHPERVLNVFENGLLPSDRPNWGGSLGRDSAGRVYAADSYAQSKYYSDILKRQYPRGTFMPILRFRADATKWTRDDAAGGDYYSTNKVTGPFEIHDGNGWRRLTRATAESIAYREWDASAEESVTDSYTVAAAAGDIETARRLLDDYICKLVLEAIKVNPESRMYVYSGYGFRRTVRPRKVGDKLDFSFRWDRDEVTDESLAGVSTIGIDRINRRGVLRALQAFRYGGYATTNEQVVLVAGEYVGTGQDAYESIIRDAYVIFNFGSIEPVVYSASGAVIPLEQRFASPKNVKSLLRESGYDWDAGMSNNAVDAYKRRRMPASKMAAYLRTSGFVKKYPELRGVTAMDIVVAVNRDEWHHTSKRFNKTDFYWLRDVLENREVIGQLIPLRKRVQRAIKKSGGRLAVPAPEDPDAVWYYIGNDIPGGTVADAMHRWISGLSGHRQAIDKAMQQVGESIEEARLPVRISVAILRRPAHHVVSHFMQHARNVTDAYKLFGAWSLKVMDEYDIDREDLEKVELAFHQLAHLMGESLDQPDDCLLLERSYSIADVPEWFYVAVEANGDHRLNELRQAVKGKLIGVSGVSEDPEIIRQFFHVGSRNVLFAIPGIDFMQANGKMTRVMYDNPDYLFSSNMAALRRIWLKPEKPGARFDGLWQNLAAYLGLAAKRVGMVELQRFLGEYGSPLEYKLNEDRPKTPNNAHDFAKYLYSIFQQPESAWPFSKGAFSHTESYTYERVQKAGYSLQDYKRLLTQFAKDVAGVYGDEGEWIIKTRVLNVPTTSHVGVVVPMALDEPLYKVYRWMVSHGGPSDLNNINAVETWLRERLNTGSVPQFVQDWMKNSNNDNVVFAGIAFSSAKYALPEMIEWETAIVQMRRRYNHVRVYTSMEISQLGPNGKRDRLKADLTENRDPETAKVLDSAEKFLTAL
jgi:antitoxin component YwqK of YwqJK toxin-antitoxin module